MEIDVLPLNWFRIKTKPRIKQANRESNEKYMEQLLNDRETLEN